MAAGVKGMEVPKAANLPSAAEVDLVSMDLRRRVDRQDCLCLHWGNKNETANWQDSHRFPLKSFIKKKLRVLSKHLVIFLNFHVFSNCFHHFLPEKPEAQQLGPHATRPPTSAAAWP